LLLLANEIINTRKEVNQIGGYEQTDCPADYADIREVFFF
jgi:hypothetical protein